MLNVTQTLNDLPDELIKLIFSKCDLETFIVLQQVNRRFRKIGSVDSFWKKHALTEIPRYRAVLKINLNTFSSLMDFDEDFSRATYFGLSPAGWKASVMAHLKALSTPATLNVPTTTPSQKKAHRRMNIAGIFLFITILLTILSGVILCFAAEYQSLPDKQQPIIFTFTSSALFITVALVTASVGIYLMKKECIYFCLMIIPLVLIFPALRLDGVFGASFAYPLIGISLCWIALASFVIFLFFDAMQGEYLSFRLLSPLAFLCLLASYILVIIRFDHGIEISWTYCFIPFYVGLFLIVLVVTFLEDIPRIMFKTFISLMLIYCFVTSQLVLLPLRFDNFIKWSYFFVFFPFLLALLCGGIFFAVSIYDWIKYTKSTVGLYRSSCASSSISIKNADLLRKCLQEFNL
ncbi:uncharacterized protein MONOS_18640 [Monocercomonoides exilis]|uniref:uncharacterized protein n=1 Tax=Monocercomonoides exilis TaxID=2049356 RepID=UPI0035598FB6|nr:hypothetical protein MONOS_18640 [Monocercomonoides exilis]